MQQYTEKIYDGLLVLYMLVGVNFLLGRLKDFSCETQAFLNNSLAARHLFTIAALFFVIVLFTRKEPLVRPVLLPLLVLALYALFLVISRCDYRFLAAFMIVLTAMFYLEAERAYRISKSKEEEGRDGGDRDGRRTRDRRTLDLITKAQRAAQVIAMIIAIIGCIVYIGQHAREYASDWSWKTFWLGTKECRKNSSPHHTGSVAGRLMQDIQDGVLRIATPRSPRR